MFRNRQKGDAEASISRSMVGKSYDYAAMNADYDRAMQILQDLTARADAELSVDESDYADVLTRLVRDYDEQHSTLLRERAAGRTPSPIELLKYLMEEHGMNTISLGKLVGGSGKAS